MNRKILIISALVCAFFLSPFSAGKAQAQVCTPTISPTRISPDYTGTQIVSFQLPAGSNYTVCDQNNSVPGCWQIRYCDLDRPFQSCANDVNYMVPNQRIEGNKIVSNPGPTVNGRRFWLEQGISTGSGPSHRVLDYCGFRDGGAEMSITTDTGAYCDGAYSVTPASGSRIDSSTPLNVTFDGSRSYGFVFGDYAISYSKADGSNYNRVSTTGTTGGSLRSWNGTIGPLAPGDWRVMIVDANVIGSYVYCSSNFTVCVSGDPSCTSTEVTDVIGNIDSATTGTDRVDAFDYCRQAPDGPQRDACIACVGSTDSGNQQKVYTAFGCMGVSGEDLTRDLVRLLLGIVGGIALLSILAAAFLLTTSQGEVSKVKSAKELITASVSGILFIIFSIMILDFIGVRILRIPGLS